MPTTIVTSDVMRPVAEHIANQLGNPDLILADTGAQLDRLVDMHELAATGRPMLIIGLDAATHRRMVSNQDFQALIGLPQVGYLHLPFDLEKIESIYLAVQAGNRPADPLASELIALENLKESLAHLLHDLRNTEARSDQAAVQTILERGRAQGLTGDNMAVIATIRAGVSHARPLAGRSFPDIFCDVEGTLLREDGTLNERIASYLQEMSQIQPITLWSGGNIAELRAKLASLVPWRVVSKWAFGGATVAIAIDDLSKGEIEMTYGVTINAYHNVVSF